MVDHARHGTESARVLVRASCQKLREVRLAPPPESCVAVACKIRREPVVDQRARHVRGTTFVQRLFLETDTARRMARAAVTKTLHQVRAAIPRITLARLVLVRGFVEEE